MVLAIALSHTLYSIYAAIEDQGEKERADRKEGRNTGDSGGRLSVHQRAGRARNAEDGFSALLSANSSICRAPSWQKAAARVVARTTNGKYRDGGGLGPERPRKTPLDTALCCSGSLAVGSERVGRTCGRSRHAFVSSGVLSNLFGGSRDSSLSNARSRSAVRNLKAGRDVGISSFSFFFFFSLYLDNTVVRVILAVAGLSVVRCIT